MSAVTLIFQQIDNYYAGLSVAKAVTLRMREPSDDSPVAQLGRHVAALAAKNIVGVYVIMNNRMTESEANRMDPDAAAIIRLIDRDYDNVPSVLFDGAAETDAHGNLTFEPEPGARIVFLTVNNLGD